MSRFDLGAIFEGGWAAHKALNFAMSLNDEFGLGVGVLLTLVGMMLHWRMPHERIAIEELMKDGRLSEGEGRRRLRTYRICAPIATTAGFLLLLAQVLVLAE